MTKTRFSLVLLVLVTTVTAGPVQAEEHPLQLALFNPIQIVSAGDAVKGIRFNLVYGKNTTVKGLDIGLINHTTTGLSKGWQHGLVGIVDEDFLGFQDNAVNIVSGNFEGFQLGIVNSSEHASGLQLGLVNYAGTLDGLQIGLVNIIHQGGAFPVLPIINWSF